MSLGQKGFAVTEPARIRLYTAQFGDEYKAAAVMQFMEQNSATFEKATEALGFAHGVDFLFFVEDCG